MKSYNGLNTAFQLFIAYLNKFKSRFTFIPKVPPNNLVRDYICYLGIEIYS